MRETISTRSERGLVVTVVTTTSKIDLQRERRDASRRIGRRTASAGLTIGGSLEAGYRVRTERIKPDGAMIGRVSPTFATEREARTWADERWPLILAWVDSYDDDAVAPAAL